MATDKTVSPLHLERRLRHEGYQRSIKRLQRHLTPAERRFSSFIHQPFIEAFSQSLSDAVCRPSGLFGAGLAGVVGSTVLMAAAQNRGFSYNYGWVLIFLAGGFTLGLLVEWLLQAGQRRR